MGLFKYRFKMTNPTVRRDTGGWKVRLVKDLRDVFLIGLKEAKDIADGVETGQVVEREYTMFMDDFARSVFEVGHGIEITIIGSAAITDVADIPMVFVVMKNSDMTEGRGPMIIDSIFSNLAAATEYIDVQPGVMGRKAKWSAERYGDWRVDEMPLCATAAEKSRANIAAQKAKALAKLTPFERNLLGLA